MQKKNNNHFLINVIAQIFILAANLGINFFLTPFIVAKLGSETYGYVGLANDFVNYAMILTVALNSMAGRYITIALHQEKNLDANKYFTTTLISNVVISIFLAIIGSILIIFLEFVIYIPNSLNFDVKMLFFFILLNFLISIIGSVFGVATFSTNKLYLQSKRKIESYIIKIIILIVCYSFFKPYILYVGLATVLSSIYVVLVDVYYTKKLLPNISIKKQYFEFNKLKEILVSGIWSSISKLSSVLSSGLNLLISNKFVSSIAMGSLSVARTLPTMILSAFGLIASVFSPDLTIYYAKNDYEQLKKEVIKSIKFLGSFSCVFVTFLFAYGNEFFALWVPGQDSHFLNQLSILSSFALIVALPMENFWNLFIATNKVKISSIALISDAVLTVLSLSILLGCFNLDNNSKMYIITGVSSAFSLLLSLIFLPIYGAKCIKEKNCFFYPILIKVVIITLISTILSVIIKHYLIINSWLNLIINTLLTGIICLILDYFVILSKDDKFQIKNFIKNVRNINNMR